MATLAGGAFVGRQREVGKLKTILEDALSSQGRLVMLAGEPGIGKTRTVQELSVYAVQCGAQVLWGRCYEEPGMPPYWPWVQIIRSYVRGHEAGQLRSEMGDGAAGIAEVVPEVKERLPDLQPLPPLEPQQARFRLFDSIATFLIQASRTQPLVLVLDNLHWADHSSLLMLEFLVQELADCRILVMGTYRSTELIGRHPLNHTLGELARHTHCSRVFLQGLSEEEVGSFIQARAGHSVYQDLIHAVHTCTEGNPLFMTHVIQLLDQQGALAPATGVTSREWSFQMPPGVQEVIRRRLEHLSEECNQVLTVASVVGREFGLDLLERLMAEPGIASWPGLTHGLNSESSLEALEEALAARVIEEMPHTASRYQFTHVLVQNTLAQGLSAVRRSRLHARIGQALEELYGVNVEAHAGELAYHFVAAEPVLGTEKLVRYSLLAGEQALGMYAWEEARRHFELALVVKERQPIDPQTAALLQGIGRVEAVILERDQIASVVPSLERAFDYYAEIGDVDRAVLVALEHPGPPVVRSPEVTKLLARALALVAADSHQAGQLLSRYGSQLGSVDGDYEAARNAFEQALSIAHREGDTTLEMRTLVDSSRAAGHNCYWQASLQQSQQAIHLADLVNDPSYEVPARHWAMSSAIVLGDLEQAKEHARAGLALGQRLRHRSMLAIALSNSEIMARISGDFSAARELSEQVLTVSPQDSAALHLRVLLECQVGELTKAEEYLAQVLQLGPPKGVPGASNLFRSILAGWVWYITGLATGLDLAEKHARAVLSWKADWGLGKAMAWAGLGLIAVYRADADAAKEHYAALKRIRGTLFYGIIADDRLLGILSQTMGELNQAVTHFEDALAFCRKGYWPELAWTCCEYAETLLQRHRPDDQAKATSLLDESLSLSQQLGMKPLMERVIGLQERAQSHPGRGPVYPKGLTERQVEVLRLIAQGKTSHEIAQELVLSERTVQRHIADIYLKIDARNRADATAFFLSKLNSVK